jgi:hypothetical protein
LFRSLDSAGLSIKLREVLPCSNPEALDIYPVVLLYDDIALGDHRAPRHVGIAITTLGREGAGCLTKYRQVVGDRLLGTAVNFEACLSPSVRPRISASAARMSATRWMSLRALKAEWIPLDMGTDVVTGLGQSAGGYDMPRASEEIFRVSLQGSLLEEAPAVAHVHKHIDVAAWSRVAAGDRPEHAHRPRAMARGDAHDLITPTA